MGLWVRMEAMAKAGCNERMGKEFRSQIGHWFQNGPCGTAPAALTACNQIPSYWSLHCYLFSCQ